MTVRPEVAAPVLILAWAYAVGWWQLRHRGGAISAWRIAASAGGWLGVLVALSAPLDRLAHASFAAHMIQHLLLIAGAAPLLLLADPFAALCWALPAPVRLRAGRLLRGGAPLRALWRGLTTVSLAWLTHVAALWLWHLPRAYDAAVADRVVHDVEHLVFFGTAVLFWWPIIQPWPSRSHWPRWAMIPYLLVADLQNTALAAILSFCDRVLYPTYDSVPRLWNISSLSDQAAAGAIMWVPGSLAFLITAGVITVQILSTQRGVRPKELFARTADHVHP